MRKMMILIPALALLMLLAAVAPVMAEPAKKVPVTGTSTAVWYPGPDAEYWITDGGILQFRGLKTAGMTTINIPGSPSLVLKTSGDLFGMVNFKTGDGVMHCKSVWKYPAVGTVVGTFEGEFTADTTGGYPATYSTMHCVLQGTGIFEGQTLMLSGEMTPPAPGLMEGFLLTR